MVSLLVFLFILGLLIIVHEFGHFIIAKRCGVRVEQFSLGFGPRLLQKTKGGTEYSISAIPLGGFVKLAGDNMEEYKGRPDEYLSQPVKSRALIIFFGPLLNYLLGFLCFWMIFFYGYPTFTNKVGGLLDGYGAKDAGVVVGDQILSLGGEPVKYWDDIQRIVRSRKDSPVLKMVASRGGKNYEAEVKIRQKEVGDTLGQNQSVGIIGITPYDELTTVRYSFWKSAQLAGEKTWELTAITYQGLARMLIGKMSVRESVTGPLGIFYITAKAARLGVIAVFHLIAVLSVSLAIFNLLPLPILDGGHLFFLLLEKIKGRPLSQKSERFITQVGLALIIALALFVTYNDIVRFFGERITRFFTK
jgi:regulator of sigma E protease